MKNERGFTLVEMMIVLMIISTLLLITIPSVTKNNSVVNNKGCDALVQLIGAQVQAYKIAEGQAPPDLDTLVAEDYIKTYTCPGGGDVYLAEDGSVSPPATQSGT